MTGIKVGEQEPYKMIGWERNEYLAPKMRLKRAFNVVLFTVKLKLFKFKRYERSWYKPIDPLEYLKVPKWLNECLRLLKEKINDPQELKIEMSQLKRRIERQEKEYIQTMRLNSILRNQIELQSQSRNERSRSPIENNAQQKNILSSYQNQLEEST